MGVQLFRMRSSEREDIQKELLLTEMCLINCVSLTCIVGEWSRGDGLWAERRQAGESNLGWSFPQVADECTSKEENASR